MKIPWVSTAFVFFIVLGIVIFSRILIQQEQRSNTSDLLSRGNCLVSLIALHSLDDFEEDKRNLLPKILAEYTTDQGLIYCFINGQSGRPFVTMASDNVASKIPNEIQMKSLSATGLTKQEFEPDSLDYAIYEFSKPIFENGQKTGTVRIGLRLPGIPIFSMERIGLLAVLVFLIISAVIIAYYGITCALRPLELVQKKFLGKNTDTKAGHDRPLENLRITPLVEDLLRCLMKFDKNLKRVKENNFELTSRLSVLSFEKNQLDNITNSINFGIIITDTQGHVGYINNYFLGLLNITCEDAVDRPLDEVLTHNEITSFISRKETLEQTITSHLDTTFPELVPGEIFRISLSYLLDNEETPIGKMVICNNITREKTVENSTHEFIAHLTHELMTPLTTIKSYSEMLMEGDIEDSDTQKEFYNTINGETDRLKRLIKDLLDISKIEMGNLTSKKDLVKSDLLFEDCITAVEGTAQKKNIVIERAVPDNFPSLVGDKDQLKASIINVLGNAVKYTPEGGHVDFGLYEQDGTVIFEVNDSGYGMSEEELAHVFDKFYRSNNPQIAEQQGSGLGMAIAVEMVRLHNGEIEVQSELGKGTRFTIKIPKKEYSLENQ